MKHSTFQALALLLVVAGLAVAYNRARSQVVMVKAAKNFLAALTQEQRAKATFSFDDSERKNFHFIPRARKGVPFKELQPFQQKLAHAFLSAGLSQRGYMKATTIMSLEQVLLELEQGKGPVRDPDLYYFSVFGEPSESQTWGWRVEGHHVSLNFTVVKGQMIASTPAFLGANPAEVRQGPRQGLRALAAEEDLARELLAALTPQQRKVAVIEADAPKDIITAAKERADIGAPKGLAAAKMSKKQIELLGALLDEYAYNMPEDVAQARMDAVRKHGIDKVYFAWAGPMERGKGHYYRVQGPTFLVEYDNTQNNANHIHSVWRDFNGDFGVDLLAEHYRQDHQPGSRHAE